MTMRSIACRIAHTILHHLVEIRLRVGRHACLTCVRGQTWLSGGLCSLPVSEMALQRDQTRIGRLQNTQHGNPTFSSGLVDHELRSFVFISVCRPDRRA